MGTSRELLCGIFAAAIAITRPGFGADPPFTRFHNATGNNLWSDPDNWSDGLPGPTSQIETTAGTFNPLDLGGQTRVAAGVTLYANNVINGTLATGWLYSNLIDYPSTHPVIDATLTGLGGRLWLSGDRQLRINGPIVGDGLDVTIMPYAGPIFLAGASTYTGRTFVDGRMVLGAEGSAGASAEWRINASLLLDNSVSALADRLGDSATVRLDSGPFTLIGHPQTPIEERIGPVVVAGPNVELSVNAPGAPVILRARSLERAGHGVLNVNLGANARLLVDQAPALIGGLNAVERPVIPFIVKNGQLATYHGGEIRALDPLTEMTADFPAGGSPLIPNVLLTAGRTLSTDTAINSLSVDLPSGEVITLDGADLTVKSGAMVFGNGARFAGSGTLSSPAEMIITSYGSLSFDARVGAPRVSIGGNIKSLNLNAPIETADLGVAAGLITVRHPAGLGSAARLRDFQLLTFDGVDQIDSDIAFGAEFDPDRVPTGFTNFQTLRVYNTDMLTLGGSLFGGGYLGMLNQATIRLTNVSRFDALYLDGAGTWLIDGEVRPVSDTRRGRSQIASPATLGGNGTFLGRAAGTAAPGHPNLPGVLTVDSFDGEKLEIDIDGTTPSEYDRLIVEYAFSGGRASLAIDAATHPALHEEFLIVDNRFSGPVHQTFENQPEESIIAVDEVLYRISYKGGDGNDITLTVVPEPGIMGITLGFFAVLRRKRTARPVI